MLLYSIVRESYVIYFDFVPSITKSYNITYAMDRKHILLSPAPQYRSTGLRLYHRLHAFRWKPFGWNINWIEIATSFHLSFIIQIDSKLTLGQWKWKYHTGAHNPKTHFQLVAAFFCLADGYDGLRGGLLFRFGSRINGCERFDQIAPNKCASLPSGPFDEQINALSM